MVLESRSRASLAGAHDAVVRSRVVRHALGVGFAGMDHQQARLLIGLAIHQTADRLALVPTERDWPCGHRPRISTTFPYRARVGASAREFGRVKGVHAWNSGLALF